MLYAITKLLFEKTNALRLIEVTSEKTNALVYSEVTFTSGVQVHYFEDKRMKSWVV
jgi:hypothetical protein